MSFGFSVGDFIAASAINVDAIRAIRKWRKDDAIIVQSFKVLQSRRIDEMQEELNRLS